MYNVFSCASVVNATIKKNYDIFICHFAFQNYSVYNVSRVSGAFTFILIFQFTREGMERHGGVDLSVISWLYLQLSCNEDWKSLADQEQDVLGHEIRCSAGKDLS